MSTPIFFLLGATGYIGSQFVFSLKNHPTLSAKVSSAYRLVALVRNPESEISKALSLVWPGIELVKGTLDDTEVIGEWASKAKIVFNAAIGEHEGSVKAILAGLSSQSGSELPLYIHISGLGITSDNANGALIPEDQISGFSDDTFSLDKVPVTNRHQNTDQLILAAAKGGKIRTVEVYPAVVYGFGDGVTRLSPIYRVFPQMFIQFGFAGTWGAGENHMSVVHIKDVGSALVTILGAALEGKAGENEQGYYFVISEAKPIKVKEFIGGIAKELHSNGLIPSPETIPLPDVIIDSIGPAMKSAMGGNAVKSVPARLKALGWEAKASKEELGFYESMKEEMAVFLEGVRK